MGGRGAARIDQHFLRKRAFQRGAGKLVGRSRGYPVHLEANDRRSRRQPGSEADVAARVEIIRLVPQTDEGRLAGEFMQPLANRFD